MAEPTGIDAALRDAFHRAAEPGDPTGVADAIRSRVAGGDAGTPATGPSAPGFRGGPSWILPAVLVAVGAVVAGTLGAGLGASGTFGRITDEVSVAGYTSVLTARAALSSCPGGPIIGSIGSNTRVLAVERSADGQYLGIRNPADFSSVAWILSRAVTIDDYQPLASSLPVVDECPVVTVSTPAPEPTPEPTLEPTPEPAPQPGPATDTVKPTLGTPTATPNPVYNQNDNGNGPEPLIIQVAASDNVGVASVLISWTGAMSGSGPMSKSGGVWKFSLNMPPDHFGHIIFTMRAKDAAGNLSSPVSIDVDHQYFG